VSDLIPAVVICAGALFLLLAGENVSRWIRSRHDG
jgi:hypothetical protein